MRPAVYFPHVAGVFVALVSLGAGATLRVIDWHGTRGPSAIDPSTGEIAVWTAAAGIGVAFSAVTLSFVAGAANAERAFTRAPVASMPQRNAALVGTAFVLLFAAALVFLLLALFAVVTLPNALTVVGVLCGPVPVVWYWASVLPYEYLPRNR